MPYAVVLYLDSQRYQPIYGVIRELAEKGIAPYMYKEGIVPHITLVIYDDLRCERCKERLKIIAKRMQSLELNFSHIGVFITKEPAVFLAPTVTSQLLNLHLEVYETLEKNGIHPWELYLPGKWVPHCTLALEIPSVKIPKAAEIAQKLILPIKLKAKFLGVIKFMPVVNLFKFKLRNN